MAAGEGPAWGEPAGERSVPQQASAPGGQAVLPSSWINEETPLPALMWVTLKRLVRRARASGPAWVVIAVLISGGLLLRQYRARTTYEVSVIVRVSDGGVGTKGAALNGGALRGYIDGVAFTAANLTALVQRHPREFPDTEPGPRRNARSAARQHDGLSRGQRVSGRTWSGRSAARRAHQYRVSRHRPGRGVGHRARVVQPAGRVDGRRAESRSRTRGGGGGDRPATKSVAAHAVAARRRDERREGDRGGPRAMAQGAGSRRGGAAGAARGRGAADAAVQTWSRRGANRSESTARPPSSLDS